MQQAGLQSHCPERHHAGVDGEVPPSHHRHWESHSEELPEIKVSLPGPSQPKPAEGENSGDVQRSRKQKLDEQQQQPQETSDLRDTLPAAWGKNFSHV